MDDNIGSLIVYLILAVLGILGSLNKGKKANAGKAKMPKPGGFFDMPTPKKTVPPVYRQETQPKPIVPPQPDYRRPIFSFEAEEEGEYQETFAGPVNDEGQREDPLAGRYRNEGSMTDTFADRYSKEGSMDDKLAAAFAGEGVSSLSSARIKSADNNAIEEGEIKNAEEYNYNEEVLGDLNETGINLKKAVIYSEILNRKEYAF